MPGESRNGFPFITRRQFDFEHGSSYALVLQTISPSSDIIEVRGLTKEGPFTFAARPTGNNSLETFTFAVPDVPVSVSVMMNPASAAVVAAAAILHLSINGNRTFLLGQGNVAPLFGFSWPHTLSPSLTQELNMPEEFTIAPPGAQSDFTQTVPANQYWQILGIHVELDTDANAANRTFRLDILNSGSKTMFTVNNQSAIVANTVVLTNFIPEGTTGVITANLFHEVRLPPHLYMNAGWSLESSTTNLQVADAYTFIRMRIRRHYLRTV